MLNTNKKILLIPIIIIILIIMYIYYKNNNTYEEFKIDEEGEEEVSYENTEDKQNKTENEKESQGENKENSDDEETIVVHITGEVKNWGVIELEKNSRIIDAVNKAGGFTDDADVEKVNLAYVLTDGVKIYIPSKSEAEETYSNTGPYITENSGDNVIMEESEMKKEVETVVNINQATQTELETLPGIGPSIALKIIAYRQENGKFSSIEDIKNVSGIGDSKFNSIKEFICV